VDGRGHVDPLLLLEVARQAATLGGHLHRDVPRSAVAVLNDFRLDVVDAPVRVDPTEPPAELMVDVSVVENRTRAGRPGNFTYTMELGMATVDMTVTWLPGEQYQALRRMARRGEPPNAFTISTAVEGEPLEPARVGRFNPANVVVRGLAGTTAALDPGCYRNHSMFDHPYDHVPAMVLTEAARQLSGLVASRPANRPCERDDPRPSGLDTAQIRGLRGRFTSFVELDAVVRLAATPVAGGLDIVIEQGGRQVADITIASG
jgi:hypothetical protein